MIQLPNPYYEKLEVTCDKCGEVTEVQVPYTCVQHDFPCNEIYTKSVIDFKNLDYSCNCEEIRKKVKQEYSEMRREFPVDH